MSELVDPVLKLSFPWIMLYRKYKYTLSANDQFLLSSSRGVFFRLMLCLEVFNKVDINHWSSLVDNSLSKCLNFSTYQCKFTCEFSYCLLCWQISDQSHGNSFKPKHKSVKYILPNFWCCFSPSSRWVFHPC